MNIPKLNEFYVKIYKYNIENGYPPDYRTMCKLFNVSSTNTVYMYIEQLKQIGYLENSKTCPRSFVLLKKIEDILIKGCVAEVVYPTHILAFENCYKIINGDFETTYPGELYFVKTEKRYNKKEYLLVANGNIAKTCTIDNLLSGYEILGKIEGVLTLNLKTK